MELRFHTFRETLPTFKNHWVEHLETVGFEFGTLAWNRKPKPKPDSRVLFMAPIGSNWALRISVSMTLTLTFFLLELVLNSLAKPQYICRFSFWLDLAASLSLLPETWFWKQILSSNFIASNDESFTHFLYLGTSIVHGWRSKARLIVLRMGGKVEFAFSCLISGLTMVYGRYNMI